MGKGTIVSGGENGLYSVTLLLDRVQADKALARINAWILMKEEQIAALWHNDPENKVPRLKLELASLQKQKEYLERIPADPTVSAWCADLSEELFGNVGTIEINGDVDKVLIRPGYDDLAAYDADKYGQLQYGIAMTPEQWFYNAAMKPGWKKWMPTYRIGTIIFLDIVEDKCNLILDDATTNIINDGGVSVNEASTLTDVPIVYMTCNSGAFQVDDRVVVEFVGQDFDFPQVIGFESSPKQCGGEILLVRSYNSSLQTACWFAWDPEKNDYAERVKAVDNILLETVVVPKASYPVNSRYGYPTVSLEADGRVSVETFTLGTLISTGWEAGIPLLGHYKPGDFVYRKEKPAQWSRISHVVDRKVYLENPGNIEISDNTSELYCMSIALPSIYYDSEDWTPTPGTGGPLVYTIVQPTTEYWIDNFTGETIEYNTVSTRVLTYEELGGSYVFINCTGNDAGNGDPLGSFDLFSHSKLGIPVRVPRSPVNSSYSTNKYTAQLYAYYRGETFENLSGVVDNSLTEWTWYPEQTHAGCEARPPLEEDSPLSNAALPRTNTPEFLAAVKALINKSGVSVLGAYANYRIDTVFYSEVRFILHEAVGYIADCANVERGAE
jgi:hypothetical protein